MRIFVVFVVEVTGVPIRIGTVGVGVVFLYDLEEAGVVGVVVLTIKIGTVGVGVV